MAAARIAKPNIILSRDVPDFLRTIRVVIAIAQTPQDQTEIQNRRNNGARLSARPIDRTLDRTTASNPKE